MMEKEKNLTKIQKFVLDAVCDRLEKMNSHPRGVAGSLFYSEEKVS